MAEVASIRLTCQEVEGSAGSDSWRRQALLRLCRGGNGITTVEVRLSESARTVASGSLNADGDDLFRLLARFAVRRVEAIIQSTGTADFVAQGEPFKLHLGSDDVQPLVELHAGKPCRYLTSEVGEMYCAAAGAKDRTAVGTVGVRHLAPTSSSVCQGCNMPSSDVACSRLLHPTVTGVLTMGAPLQRLVTHAICDAGHDQKLLGQPLACVAGGNDCWERLVAPNVLRLPDSVSPLALPEALGYLDAVWRNVFGAPLLKVPPLEAAAGLALGCTNRDEFTSRLTAVVMVLDGCEVTLAPEIVKQLGPGRQHAVARIEAALTGRLADTDDQGSVVQAAAVLRDIKHLRNSFQHGSPYTDAKARDALERLGIALPFDWPSAWDRVRSAATTALRQMRETAQALQ